MIWNRKNITLLFAAAFVFAVSSLFGQWSYSERNLADLDSKLDSLQKEIEANGITAELEPLFLEVGEYGFRRWLASNEDAERNTRDVISKYNEINLKIILESENRNDVMTNVASRLLSATNPISLTESDIRRLVDDGKSKDLAIYGITKHLGLYDGQVEEMVARVFIEEPNDRVSLAVSLGLDAAASFMLEAVSSPFDSESLTAETSLITTISEDGGVIQKEQVIYGFVKNGNAESIRRAAEWLLNTNKAYPEVARALSLRLQEIDYFLPKGAMPQFRGLLQSATATVAKITPTPQVVEVVPEVIEEVIAPEPVIEEEPAEVVVAEPVKEEVEPSSNWWLWLIGAVVVVGGVFVLRSRK